MLWHADEKVSTVVVERCGLRRLEEGQSRVAEKRGVLPCRSRLCIHLLLVLVLVFLCVLSWPESHQHMWRDEHVVFTYLLLLLVVEICGWAWSSMFLV